MTFQKHIQQDEHKAIHYVPFELEPSWAQVLQDELQKPYISQLAAFVKEERAKGKEVYPPENLVFNAFWKTPYDKVKVVIVGQDPYHGPNQAHGLSFSVSKGVPQPPSLKNIFKELADDVGVAPPNHGCLVQWAEQGVMLLNATLTVERSKPLSHHKRGWERFTDSVIRALALRTKPVIFVLWGKNAQEKCKNVPELMQHSHHFILSSAHPSPYSASNGFFGCKHFSKINSILESSKEKPINWKID